MLRSEAAELVDKGFMTNFPRPCSRRDSRETDPVLLGKQDNTDEEIDLISFEDDDN